jgi:hypothetical protein
MTLLASPAPREVFDEGDGEERLNCEIPPKIHIEDSRATWDERYEAPT